MAEAVPDDRKAKEEAAQATLSAFVQKGPLQEGFYVALMTEVCREDASGGPVSSLGFLEDNKLAKVYAGQQPGPGPEHHYTREVYVLTDGTTVFELKWNPAPILDGKRISAVVQDNIRVRFTPEEWNLLGL